MRGRPGVIPNKLDAQHWRDRAAQMRALAGVASDTDAKDTMLRIALDYDRLAERAELQRPRPAPP